MPYYAQARITTKEPTNKNTWKKGTPEQVSLQEARLRTPQKHNLYANQNKQNSPPDQQPQYSNVTKKNNMKKETLHHENAPWETLGYIRKEQIRTNGETQKKIALLHTTMRKTRNSPNNLEKQVVKAHNIDGIRLSRQQVNCPFCNKEYSNAISLLTHLATRTAKMTWKRKHVK